MDDNHMLRLIAKFILSLIIVSCLCGTSSAIEKEVHSEVVISTRIGSADGEFGYKTYTDDSWIEPTAIAIDSSGNIFISDPLYSRIQKFDKNGKYISKISIKNNRSHVTFIIDLTIDKLGTLYALNKFDDILIFNSNGKLINTISLEDKGVAWSQTGGWYNGRVQCEKIAVDDAGNIYLQTVFAVVKIDHKGNVLNKWQRNIYSYASAFLLSPDGNFFFQKSNIAWEMYDRNGHYLRVVDDANNPYPAFCSSADNDCHFPPSFIDAKGNYYYYGLDRKTGDLESIYKFNREHKLVDRQANSSLDYNVQLNMVKFDDAGSLYGPSKFGPTKKRKFPMILKITTEK